MRHFGQILTLMCAAATIPLLISVLGCPSPGTTADSNVVPDDTNKDQPILHGKSDDIIPAEASEPSVASGGLGVAALNLKLPFRMGETWLVTQGYGETDHGDHAGRDAFALDFTMPGCDAWDRPILAVADGIAYTYETHTANCCCLNDSSCPATFGRYVIIKHNSGYISWYGHLSAFSVTPHAEGVAVKQGQEIGRCGNAGCSCGTDCADHPGTHLHLRITYTDEAGNVTAVKPEPMSGVTSFQRGQYTSDNEMQVEARPTSCVYTDGYPRADPLLYPRCPGTADCLADNTHDPWGFYNGECVSYVAWRLNHEWVGDSAAPVFLNTMHSEISDALGKWGSAGNWDDRALALTGRTTDFVIEVSSIPAEGSIAHWNKGEYGYGVAHVAYVEHVNDDNSVDITEYNFNPEPNDHRFGCRAGKTAPRYLHIARRQLGAAPTISSISPESYLASDNSQLMTVNGAAFQSGATLTFDPPTGANIESTAAKLTFVSSSELTYQFKNSNDVGTWAVRVRNPDGQASGWATFSVTNSTPPAQQYTLTVTCQGQGHVNPSGGTYSAGTQVTLTASAESGWRFDHWEGALTGNANPAPLSMIADRDVTGVFVLVSAPTGACCFGSTCTDALTEPACVAGGGVFKGAGSVCSSNPCPQPTGACCVGTACTDGVTQSACNGSGGLFEGPNSSCSPNPCETPPAQPTNLEAVGSSNKALMSWHDNSNNESGFRIERKTGSGTWSRVGETGPGESAFQDTGLSYGATYWYRVCAYNTAGDSASSNSDAAIALAAPSLTAPSNGGTITTLPVTLTWDSVVGAELYGIDMGTGSCGATQILDNQASGASTTYAIGSLANGTYYWRVRAANSAYGGVSAASACRSFTVNVPQPPSISSISPSSYPCSYSSQTMTIYGSNFQAGATLTFNPPTGPDIPSTAAKLTVNSSTRITYLINNACDTGTWKVQVHNPDGQSSGWTSFTVTP